jgi:hypothetical protein
MKLGIFTSNTDNVLYNFIKDSISLSQYENYRKIRFCEPLGNARLYLNFLIESVEITGLVTSLLSFIIFIKMIKNERNQSSGWFKYLLSKSIVDFLILSIEILPFTDSKYYGMSYFWTLWMIYIDNYLKETLICISGYLECIASIDIYSTINNKFKFIQKRSFFIGFHLILIIYNFILNVDFLFIYDLGSYKKLGFNLSVSNQNQYITLDSSFTFTIYHKILNVLIVLNRELFPLVIILFMNILILKTMKMVSSRKRKLTANTANIQCQNAEINKTKMIFFIGLNYILLHLPLTISKLILHSRDLSIRCTFTKISEFLYYSSYIVQFILYYFFNNQFRKHFKMTLRFK